MNKDDMNYEKFLRYVEGYYHNFGHMMIARDCITPDAGSAQNAVMSYSEVSARDPIFFKWHGHLENFLQIYRDTKLPAYSQSDFSLTDGVSVFSVQTAIDGHDFNHPADIQNFLITHLEKVNIMHGGASQITYERINHIPFKYIIGINNPEASKKKVIVRLWLGLIDDIEKK